MPAVRKVSALQMEVLVSFMEAHMALARGQLLDTPQAKSAARQQWEQLAAQLNAIKGHRKSTRQWRDYWRDIKYRVKRKVGQHEVQKQGAVGGLRSTEVIAPVEKRISAIIGRRGVLSPAAKLKRRADASTTAANTTEIPQLRLAQGAEQNRPALDHRRLEAVERAVALLAKVFERSVAAQERTNALLERMAAAQEDTAATLRSIIGEKLSNNID